ncbi:alpha/beta fold hydrolase [Streptomyces durbertensis]|uniref:Alpha/beta fold hydrolase n=1 Tax=Streptomyces durbertensis TaxID=2448886 RepID=A0ABR6EGM9_9ACTN|nr:alpha/beta fold hydrolase [Streptomyces durbertensis]MBB1244125.1 alpha/beta fold hydrolase [Streptomyces durbertensis]
MSEPNDLAAFHTQRPAWTPSEFDPAVEQATIEVPLDYSDPAGERISVAVSRRRADDPERRLGVLVALCGGPGGNEGLGLEVSARFAKTPLPRYYDIIGFDPRGYGESTPLYAETAPRRAAFDTRPTDDQLPLIAEDMRAAEEGCARAGGELRRHVNTRNIARDLDIVRAVLGEERVNYVGYAYGTYLGAVYGTLFPDRLHRSVLDSCVHPDWLWHRQFRMQADAIRNNVDAWAAWTGERDRRFGLGRGRERVMEAVEEVAAKLAAQPLNGLNRTLYDVAVGNGATLRPEWTSLADLVAGLRDGSEERTAHAVRTAMELANLGVRAGTSTARTARAKAAAAAERAAAELAQQGVVSLRPAVLEAITSEADWPTDLEEYYADMRRVREECPYGYAVMRAMPWVSTFRSFEPPEPTVEVANRGYPAGLVIQAENDPLNHSAGAVAMAERLGHHLVVVADEGSHELYPEAGNERVNALVTRYLLEGELPARRVVCPGNPRPAVAPDPAGPRP